MSNSADSAVATVVDTLVERLPRRALNYVCRKDGHDRQRLLARRIDDDTITERLSDSGLRIVTITKKAVLDLLGACTIEPDAEALFATLDCRWRGEQNPFVPLVRALLASPQTGDL